MTPDFDARDIELLGGVRDVIRITQPYKLAGRAFCPEGSVIDVGRGVRFGGTEVVVAAGPCAVESADQIFQIAEGVARMVGARVQYAERSFASRIGRGAQAGAA